MRQSNPTPLIPREVLFGNPDKASVQLSPDGGKISYLAPLDGVLNVWVGPVDNLEMVKPVTNDTGRGIRFYGWAYTNNHVLYIQDKDGDENWRVYSVDLNTEEIKDLTPLEDVQARVQQASHKFPDEVLVGLNDRNPELHDLYRVNLKTGERRLIQHNKDFVYFTTDDDYNVRFATRNTPDGGFEHFELDEVDNWQPSTK